MKRQILDRVTITGADDSTDPGELLELSRQFPFVEWGILFSKSSEGKPRYPSREWICDLYNLWDTRGDELILSGHICGRWVRDICEGKWTILDDYREVHKMFARFQLNFHSYVHKLDKTAFCRGFVDERLWFKQFVFQLDDVNNSILDVAREADIDAVALFDLSGGAGILPNFWPVARNHYCGYAGGLAPENVEEQLTRICEVVDKGPIWIDVETKVRSDDDQILDMAKVREFLEKTYQWVEPPKIVELVTV